MGSILRRSISAKGLTSVVLLSQEFAHQGFSSQGNEWSAYMLFASNYVLNELAKKPLSVKVYPFAHMYCNNLSSEHQLLPVQIPDVDPGAIPKTATFSMSAGDFLQAYTEADQYDVIASAFFVDTARNIIAYIERMYDILKPGGHLINFGPLLYHFDDNLEVRASSHSNLFHVQTQSLYRLPPLS
eukprot:m.101515 g.101515  ORF g.101515 m.101515 type:complete len:185 (+) comp15174_c1_seq2:503-1057(+)